MVTMLMIKTTMTRIMLDGDDADDGDCDAYDDDSDDGDDDDGDCDGDSDDDDDADEGGDLFAG